MNLIPPNPNEKTAFVGGESYPIKDGIITVDDKKVHSGFWAAGFTVAPETKPEKELKKNG